MSVTLRPSHGLLTVRGNDMTSSGIVSSKFRYVKHDDKWMISGPVGYEYQIVIAVRRDGSTGKNTLGHVVHCDGDEATYHILQ